MSFRDYYRNGISEFYFKILNYKNPHEPNIKKLLDQIQIEGSVLDLACGSGEVTKCLKHKCHVTGVDPYTYEQYTQETGCVCFNLSFDTLSSFDAKFDTVICSYAMHLVPKSRLPDLLFTLTFLTKRLIIITPHKRPKINLYWHEVNRIKENRTTLIEYQINC